MSLTSHVLAEGITDTLTNLTPLRRLCPSDILLASKLYDLLQEPHHHDIPGSFFSVYLTKYEKPLHFHLRLAQFMSNDSTRVVGDAILHRTFSSTIYPK